MASTLPGEAADGLLCPRCGRRLTWIGTTRGGEFVRRPIEMVGDSQIGSEDIPEQVPVSRRGYEVRTKTVWRHWCTLQCKRCGVMYSEDQAGRGEAEPEPEVSLSDLPEALRDVVARAMDASARAVQAPPWARRVRGSGKPQAGAPGGAAGDGSASDKDKLSG